MDDIFMDDILNFILLLGVIIIAMIVVSIKLNNYSNEKIKIIESVGDFQSFQYCEKINSLYYCK